MAKSEHQQKAAELLLRQRWAALATVDENSLPAASMVAYATDIEQGCLYLHLSTLASHSRHLLQRPAASLVISEGDDGDGDPQQLARLSLRGECTALEMDAEGYVTAKQCYLERLPHAEVLFSFSDFVLFRFTIKQLRFIGGFGSAFSYQGEKFAAALGHYSRQVSLTK